MMMSILHIIYGRMCQGPLYAFSISLISKNALTYGQLIRSFLIVHPDIFLDGVVCFPSPAWDSRDTEEHSFFSYWSRPFP